MISKRKRIIKEKKALPGDSTQKICDPKSSLAEIIKNFEQSCPKSYNNFNEFVEKTQCEYCKKGVPPEVMMAMISIESAGKCPAELRNPREISVGLCQINSKVHQCRDLKGKTYRIRTRDNQRCFKNPINSCNKGTDILAEYYCKGKL